MRRSKSLSVLFGLALVAIQGCALIEPTNPFTPVEGVKGAGGLAGNSSWRAAPLEVTGPLTLERCVETALANNPEVAATAWDASAAGYRLDQARGANWPTASIESSSMRYLDPQRLFQATYNGEKGVFDPNLFRNDVVVSLPLFAGGRIVNDIKAAELLEKAEHHRLARTREELVFNVTSAFNAILGQRRVIESIEFSLKAMEQHRTQVSDLYGAQKAAKVDLLRTDVRLADLQQTLVKERNTLAVLKRLLLTLMGGDYGEERPDIEGKLTFEEAAYSADQLTGKAIEGRPDYLAAKERLEAQAKRVDAARAGHWPTVAAVGSYGLRANGMGDSGDAGAVGVNVSIPLFQGGRVVAKVNEERANLAAAQERLRKLELQIRQEVETAVLDVRSSAERVRAIQKSIEQAQESLRIERMKYDLGSGSITDVLDAQSALLQTETNYYRALADFRTAIARIDFVTGGTAR